MVANIAIPATPERRIGTLEFARRCGKPRRTINEWLTAGRLRPGRYGRWPSGQWWIFESEVERVLSGSAGEGQEGPQSGQGRGDPGTDAHEASAGASSGEPGDGGAPA